MGTSSVLQNCKMSSHFFSLHIWMFLIWKGSVAVSFSLLHFVLRKSSCFEFLVKNMIPDTFFLSGGGPPSLLPERTTSIAPFPSLTLLSQVQVLCLTRGIQCVQNAAAAWLDTWWHWCWIPSRQLLCSGLSERWMTVPTGLFRSCNTAVSEGVVQEGPLRYLENTIFKLKPQVTTLMKVSIESREYKLVSSIRSDENCWGFF